MTGALITGAGASDGRGICGTEDKNDVARPRLSAGLSLVLRTREKVPA
jgi:hypothetical protein